ncbi:hypothetical protein PTTG_09545 [Puccinia triticina 1-1 BBBD Race 1]|uniref:Lysophospholipase n=2 Tax=Puccinia triticina TaxID=208348 RepID=A0A180GLF0_PUCT1|nr:uncharacterized protein PtA15_13A80 [Puccinia triticina]OAV93288.1 hypothetical protein PTTG_09545 [Puccinia triticina 1-1 BBBD Race 1]WAQ90681.1 hypothetical protein PtA15_13A80 [Puccinia triticina]WAR60836.1 hypothetical protein PtB15_13B82 [Puccinia triticina]
MSLFKHLTALIFLWLEVTRPSSGKLTYAPTKVECPTDFGIRQGRESIGIGESVYQEGRRTNVLPDAYQKYLDNLNAFIASSQDETLVLPSYVTRILSSRNEAELPRLSIAVGGGAYRGAIFAAGILNTLDGRNVSSVGTGIGGLLQTADYITGLSGSAWLVVSWAESELAPFYDLVLGGTGSSSRRSGWFTQYGLFDHLKKFLLGTKYWSKILDQVIEKGLAGFPISLVDLWGRVLSYHFLSGVEKPSPEFFEGNFSQGLNESFSGFLEYPSFKNYSQPYPIITTLPLSQINPGEFPSPPTSTQYEISPHEFGSYDPVLSAFVSTKHLGTRMYSGKPIDPKRCALDFDNAGFLMGVSSNLFPAYRILARAFFNLTVPLSKYTPHSINAIIPNPFLGLGTDDFLQRTDEDLELVDGGFGNEVTPYAPLLVGARGVEVIFAIDGTSDSENYANGSSIIRTAARVAQLPNAYKFPQVPSNVSTYTTEGLVRRPTFFGCDEPIDVPLVIWVANSPPIDQSTGLTNTSTVQLSYPSNQTRAMMNQAIDTSLRGFPPQDLIKKNIYRDPLWPICLSCAVTDRARAKQNLDRTGLCQDCFTRYCWQKS